MAATVSNGLTNVTLANDNTGFSTWKRDGTGGTPSAISETDVFIQGTGSCSVKVSNQGVVLAYNISAGLDLSATDTHVYIWANMLAGGLMHDRDELNPGLGIFIGYDATISGTNYDIWAVDGADTYPGGWVRYCIDVSKTPTISNGTAALSDVNWIGMYCNTQPNTAKFDNLAIDRIDYTTSGTGLAVYGTSTTDSLFQDILDADEGTVNNKYGIVTSKEGVVYVRGTIELGDDASTNAATLTDTDSLIVFETPKYWDGEKEANCLADNFQNLKIVGNGTGATSVTFGKKVGTGDTANGRNGITVIESGSPVTIDFDDGNANTVLVYGSIFRGITGGLSWGTNTAHECIGNTIDQSTQFDPVGGVEIRNCTLSNSVAEYAWWLAGGALLWNSSIDIKNCNFINNEYGIEHSATTGTPFSYDGLLFSGNSYDVLNSSNGSITINATNGANPATSRNIDTTPTTNTYYFNDSTPTDNDAAWTNDANAFDGATTTAADTVTTGTETTNELYGTGTTAPTTGNTVYGVRARTYGNTITGPEVGKARIYTASLAETLATIDVQQTTAGWTGYTSLSVPTGGWTFAKANALEVNLWRENE